LIANQANNYLFVKEETLRSGLFFRIIPTTLPYHCIASIGGKIALVKAESTSIQNTTWIVRTRSMNEQHSQVMFEMSFYPGVYITLENSLYSTSLLPENNTSIATFEVNINPLHVQHSISPETTPSRVSIMQSQSGVAKYLKHNDNQVVVEKLNVQDPQIDMYDSTWIVSKSNDTSDIAIYPLNLPGFVLNQTDTSNNVQLVENVLETSNWILTPAEGDSLFTIALNHNSKQFFSCDYNGQVQLQDTATMWKFIKPLSYPTNDALIVPKLDYLLGKTVKFTEFIRSETLLVAFTHSPEPVKPKLYR